MTIPKESRDDPFYKELNGIGRKQKSLAPSGLLSYERLLHSVEVNRRVDPEATLVRRAEASRDAITDAVNDIPGSTDRRIGQAVFCTVRPFIGLTVNERKAILAKEGIGADVFKEHRPQAVKIVFDYLSGHRLPGNSLKDNVPPMLPPRARGFPDEVAIAFEFITSAAANLHYAALSCIFVSRTDDRLAREGIEIDRDPRTAAVEDASVFSRHLYMAIGHFEGARDHLETTLLYWESEHMPFDQTSQLWFLMNTMDRYGPLRAIERKDLGHYAWLLRKEDKIAQDHQQRIAALFEKAWKRWFADNIPSFDSSGSSGVEVIAAKSAAILSILKTSVGFDEAEEARSFLHFYSLLENYYPSDMLVIDDRPIIKHADEYLKDTTSSLAGSDLIWLDLKDEASKLRWKKIRATPPKWEKY